MNRKQYLDLAKIAVNTAIKNSEIVQPYVDKKHYRRGLIALNALYFLLNKTGGK